MHLHDMTRLQMINYAYSVKRAVDAADLQYGIVRDNSQLVRDISLAWYKNHTTVLQCSRYMLTEGFCEAKYMLLHLKLIDIKLVQHWETVHFTYDGVRYPPDIVLGWNRPFTLGGRNYRVEFF